MTEDIKPDVIKKTQEILGKFIKKPVLTDKLLTKPPFRFLHDICTAAMRETGFFENVLNSTDSKVENIKDKEGKIAFLQKVIAAVEAANGIKLQIKPSKVVAGHEPQRTNEFLQALGKALEKQVERNTNATKSRPETKDSKTKVKSTKKPEKEELPAKKKSSTTKSTKGEKPETKGNEDVKKKPSSEKISPRPKPDNAKKNQSISPKGKENGIDKQDGDSGEEEKTSKHREKSKLKTSQSPSNDSSEVYSEAKTKNKESQDQPNEKTKPQTESLDTKRPVSAKPGHRKPAAENTEPALASESPVDKEQEQQEPVKPEPAPTAPVEPPPKRPESSFLRLNKQPSTNGVPQSYPNKDTSIGEDSSPISRPLTGIRPMTGRPASARPAAPRIRDRGEISVHEDVVKQTMGNVQIITDKNENNEPEEDDNVVVVEPEIELITDDLDRGDQLGSKNEENMNQEEHGLLVEQILETQKELDQSRLQITDGKSPGKTEIEWKSSRNREATEREVKKLRLLIQTLTRSANPLGKLLDMLQEDVDIMQKELANWKEMNANLDVQIAQEQSLTEQSVEPLKVHLKEIQQNIDEQLEQMTIVKANILRNDQKIHKLLTEMK